MNVEIVLLILIVLFSLILIHRSVKDSLLLLLILSVLLHKELFSIYRWDILPVRLFMLSLLVYLFFFVVYRYKRRINFGEIKKFFADPFVLLLGFLWFVRGISIFQSKNFEASIFLFGFFTTIAALGFLIRHLFSKDSGETLGFIKKYIFIVFIICLFGYFQLFLYQKFEVIVGALWNVPGHLPRIGSTFWDINHFGGLIASLLPVLGVFILVEKSLRDKVKYSFMLVPMTGILLLTSSRTSWMLGFIAFVSFITILLVRKWGLRGILVLLSLFLLISIPLIREYRIKSSPFRAYVKDNFHYRIDSFDSHFLLLTGTFQVFENYPYLGGGYGGFFEHFSKTKIAPTYFGRDPAGLNVRVPAHTIWGELIAETGIVGTSIFVLLAMLLFLTLLYPALTLVDRKKYMTSAAMASSILGWFFAGIFYSYNAEFFWIILFTYYAYGISILGYSYSLDKIVSYFFKSYKALLAVLIAISSVLIFFQLGTNHLIPWDEAIYAKIAKNMVTTGNYLTQTWHSGQPWFEKPPLAMWLMSVSMKLFGFNSWGARLPSALFGMGTVIVTYFFGRKLFNKTTGFIAGLALVTTTHFLYYSRASMLDVTLTFFFTSSLYAYYLGRVKESSRYMVLSGILGGLALMSKGVVGLFIFPVIGLYDFYLFVLGDLKLSKELAKDYINFGIAFLVIALPWHLYSYIKYGADFTKVYIGYHVIARVTTEIEDKGNPWYWYFIVMKVSMRIWFVALLGALPFALIKCFVVKSKKHILLILWLTLIFVVFSVSKSKLVWYIMPLYPAAAIIVANFVERIINLVYSKLYCLRTPTVKFLSLYFLFVGALFYLFLNKGLVYTSDLTEPQAVLLQKKDEEFGTDTMVYADRIELPLILFYSDSPFEVVDFGPLWDRLSSANYAQPVIFITKESRFGAYAKEYSQLKLVDEKNEWALGKLPSSYELDLEVLDKMEKEWERAERDLVNKSEKGEFIPLQAYEDVARMEDSVNDFKFQIEEKLNAAQQ